MENVIVDFETLGNGEEGDSFIILDVAWTFFELDGKNNFDELTANGKQVKFDVKEQQEMGWNAEKGTVKWWKSQDKEARAAILPSDKDIKLSEFVQTFTRDLEKHKPKRIWSRGTDFDLPILKRIFRSQGKNINDKLRYNSASDVRSALNAMSFYTLKYDGFIPASGKNAKFIKHNSKHDIAMDVLRLQYLADFK